MKLIEKIQVLLGLRHKWIAKRGCSLEIATNSGWGDSIRLRYKIVKGKCSIKNTSKGRKGDDSYSEEKIFKPKTEEARVLIWYTVSKKTKRYLVILKKSYKNKIEI